MLDYSVNIYITLIVIINPIGMASFYHEMTKDYSRKEQLIISREVAIYSFILYFSYIIFGSVVLNFFGITTPFIHVGGGIMLSYYAWKMISEETRDNNLDATTLKKRDSIIFVPLVMPLTVGAGSMAAALSIGQALAEKKLPIFSLFEHILFVVVSLFFVILTVYVSYRNAGAILKKLGKRGTIVVQKISAFLLFCIGLQILWRGLETLIKTLD
jgi:multiple antibiotic resistance protein